MSLSYPWNLNFHLSRYTSHLALPKLHPLLDIYRWDARFLHPLNIAAIHGLGPALLYTIEVARYFRCNLPGRKATFYDYLLRTIRGEDGGFRREYLKIDGHQYGYNDAIHLEHLYRVASQLTSSKATEYNCDQYRDAYDAATWLLEP
jgi:hypothetical protein